MQLDYVSDISEIHVREVESGFEAINHAFYLETRLRLKGEAEVICQGRKLTVTFNDSGDIVEKPST